MRDLIMFVLCCVFIPPTVVFMVMYFAWLIKVSFGWMGV